MKVISASVMAYVEAIHWTSKVMELFFRNGIVILAIVTLIVMIKVVTGSSKFGWTHSPVAHTHPADLRVDREKAGSRYFRVRAARSRCSPIHISGEKRKEYVRTGSQPMPALTEIQAVTSPLSTNARDEVWPQTMPMATLFCRQLETLRGVGWFAVEPEPTWPQLL